MGARQVRGVEPRGQAVGCVVGHGQGLAHAFVVERRPGDVEFVKLGGGLRIIIDEVRLVFQIKGDFGGRGLPDGVKLSGTKHALLGIEAFLGVEVDFIEPDIGGVPVVGASFNKDVRVHAPFLERKGAVANEMFGARPGIGAVVDGAVFLNGRNGHGKPRVMDHHREQIRSRAVQLHFKGQIVRRLEADLVEIGDFAGVKRLGVGHRIKHVGILRAQGRR